jgi:hypothetical protein
MAARVVLCRRAALAKTMWSVTWVVPSMTDAEVTKRRATTFSRNLLTSIPRSRQGSRRYRLLPPVGPAQVRRGLSGRRIPLSRRVCTDIGQSPQRRPRDTRILQPQQGLLDRGQLPRRLAQCHAASQPDHCAGRC